MCSKPGTRDDMFVCVLITKGNMQAKILIANRVHTKHVTVLYKYVSCTRKTEWELLGLVAPQCGEAKT